MYLEQVQGVPKVIVRRFGLIARPVIIWSTKCSRKVAHSRNTVSLAKLMFIFWLGTFIFCVFRHLVMPGSRPLSTTFVWNTEIRYPWKNRVPVAWSIVINLLNKSASIKSHLEEVTKQWSGQFVGDSPVRVSESTLSLAGISKHQHIKENRVIDI